MKTTLKNQGGYTMVELMAALTIFGLLSAMFFKFILSSTYGLTHVENSTDLIRLAQRMRQNMTQTVQSSQIILAELAVSPTGLMTPYQTIISSSRAASTTGAPAPVAMSVQPKIVNASKVDSTIGTNFGNELMMACVLTPMKVLVSISTTPLYSSTISLDRYQFVYIYLGTQPQVPLANFGSPGPAYGAMGVVEWRSKPFVSYSELNNLGNKLAATSAVLVGLGYSYAWDLGQTDSSKAFHAITASSPYVNQTGTGLATLGEQSWAWLTDFDFTQKYAVDPLKPSGKIVGTDRLGQSNFYISRYSAAYNTSTISAPADSINSLYGDYGINLVVPLLATATSNGFPGGLEVAVTGSSGSRLVYMRGVLMASSGTERTPKGYRGTEFESVNYVVNPN